MLNLLWHCGAVLSGLGISESGEFHLVFWVSFVVCFCLCFVCVVFFVFIDTYFFFSPILQYVGIANQRQNVLMTV